jgi:hypothetical protein
MTSTVASSSSARKEKNLEFLVEFESHIPEGTSNPKIRLATAPRRPPPPSWRARAISSGCGGRPRHQEPALRPWRARSRHFAPKDSVVRTSPGAAWHASSRSSCGTTPAAKRSPVASSGRARERKADRPTVRAELLRRASAVPRPVLSRRAHACRGRDDHRRDADGADTGLLGLARRLAGRPRTDVCATHGRDRGRD